jgi:hypothetical protein
VLHPMAEYSSNPKRGTRVPLEYYRGYPWTQGKHIMMGDNANLRSPQCFFREVVLMMELPKRHAKIATSCDSGSAIWSLTPPTRSDLRTSQRRRQRGPQTRIFSPQLILVCRRPRCRKREKWQGMRPSILTIHRTETTRRADFALHLTRRDRRARVALSTRMRRKLRVCTVTGIACSR